MICKNCGTQMPDGAEFCGVCGMTMHTQETKKKSKWLPILLSVLGIVIVGATVLLLLPTKTPAEQFAYDYVSAILEGDADALEDFFHENDDVDTESLVYHNIEDYEIKILGSIRRGTLALEEYNEYYSEENPGRAIGNYGEKIDDIYTVVYSCTVEYEDVEYDGLGELCLVEINGEYYIESLETFSSGYLNLEPEFYKNYKNQ